MVPVIRHTGRGSLDTRAIYALAVGGTPDIALVSLGTTFGLRRGDARLARQIVEAGATCRLVPVTMGAAGHLRRTMATTDAIEALAARRAGQRVKARAFIYSSVTAALAQPRRGPTAIRFDGIAAVNRPGVGGQWQRRREPGVLAAADLLLPWSESIATSATRVVEAAGRRSPNRLVLHPSVDVEPPGEEAYEAVAYAANPHKRGLALLCAAWSAIRPATGGRLAIAGIDRAAGLTWLRREGVTEPDGIRWLGTIPGPRYLSIVAGARVFVSAAMIEDWGMAQMEALAAGIPLATVPSPGANVALPLARRLHPGLVATDRTSTALAAAIATALNLDDVARGHYADRARQMLVPYTEDEVRRTVANELLPRLLNTSA